MHAPESDAGARKGATAEARRRAAYLARTRRLTRTRTIVGALGFVPLTMSLLCLTGAVEAFCAVPRELYLAVWSGLFGVFLGYTIRLFRERRRFQRGEG